MKNEKYSVIKVVLEIHYMAKGMWTPDQSHPSACQNMPFKN